MITLADAKDRLNVDRGNTTNDAELQDFVDAAVEAVEKIRGEVMDQRSITEEHRVFGGSFVCTHVPVLSLTAVQSVDGSQVWDVASLHVNKSTGEVVALPGPAPSGLVSVTYLAGYDGSTVPRRFKEAALIIVQHLNRSQRGPGSVRAGAADDMVMVPGMGFAIPRMAMDLIQSSLPGIA